MPAGGAEETLAVLAITSGPVVMTSVTAWSRSGRIASTTWTVNGELPAVVGVPDSMPVAAFERQPGRQAARA